MNKCTKYENILKNINIKVKDKHIYLLTKRKKEEIKRKMVEDLRKKLNCVNMGLTEKEAEERLKENGKNKLQDKKKESIVVKFIKQFNDFMILILIVAAIISGVMAKIDGTGDYIESIIIIAIVVFNSIMGLVQENKAEKSLEALKKMASPTCKVIRDGKEKIIPGEDVVVGDLVVLEARKLCTSRL